MKSRDKDVTVPRVRYTEGSLRRAGVEIIDSARVLVECQKCAQRWSPDLRSGGRLSRGWWKCPNGCNAR